MCNFIQPFPAYSPSPLRVPRVFIRMLFIKVSKILAVFNLMVRLNRKIRKRILSKITGNINKEIASRNFSGSGAWGHHRKACKGVAVWGFGGGAVAPDAGEVLNFCKLMKILYFWQFLMDIFVIFEKYFEFLEQIWSKYRKVLGP